MAEMLPPAAVFLKSRLLGSYFRVQAVIFALPVRWQHDDRRRGVDDGAVRPEAQATGACSKLSDRIEILAGAGNVVCMSPALASESNCRSVKVSVLCFTLFARPQPLITSCQNMSKIIDLTYCK